MWHKKQYRRDTISIPNGNLSQIVISFFFNYITERCRYRCVRALFMAQKLELH